MSKNTNDTRELTYVNAEDVEVTVDLPLKWDICVDCKGNGRHEHPAFANGVDREFLEEEDNRESYFRGDYDVTCEYCEGSGKRLVVDTEDISKEEREALEAEYEAEIYNAMERAAERRMGA